MLKLVKNSDSSKVKIFSYLDKNILEGFFLTFDLCVEIEINIKNNYIDLLDYMALLIM